MDSAKRASGNNCVWNLNFLTFLKKRGEKQEGKEVKKNLPWKGMLQKSVHRKQREKCNSSSCTRKSQKSFSFFFFRIYAWLRFQTHTHTHTCFKRVNNNNAGVRNLFPVV